MNSLKQFYIKSVNLIGKKLGWITQSQDKGKNDNLIDDIKQSEENIKSKDKKVPNLRMMSGQNGIGFEDFAQIQQNYEKPSNIIVEAIKSIKNQ